MDMLELVVIGCVGNRRKMKNCIEFFVVELLVPIERRRFLAIKSPRYPRRFLKSPDRKIIDHSQARVVNFSCRGEREIGAMKPAPPVTTS